MILATFKCFFLATFNKVEESKTSPKDMEDDELDEELEKQIAKRKKKQKDFEM